MRPSQYEPRTTNHEPRITGFTLVEILAVIIILSILTSLSIVAYQKTLETNDERICQQQQKILQGAIEAYTIENDSLPNELAQLKPEHIHLAYLKVTGQRAVVGLPIAQATGERPGNKLLAFWRDFLGTKPAIAQTPPSLGKYYNYDTKILRCPQDKTVSSDPQYTSYKINTYDFIDTADLKDSTKANTALLYDKDAYHKKAFSLSAEKFRVTTGPTGEFGKIEYGNQTNASGSGIENVDPLPTRTTGDTQISEDTNDETGGDSIINTSVDNLSPLNCCVSRADWKVLKKSAKKKCKDAGFRPQKKDGTCVDKCFNHCPSSGATS